MRRRINGAAGLGLALAFGGVGAMLADFSLDGAGRVAVIVGVILWCYHRLQANNTTANQNYELGYDLGYERGYQERDEELRPKLVDLNSHRDTGKSKAFTSAGGVVDRG